MLFRELRSANQAVHCDARDCLTPWRFKTEAARSDLERAAAGLAMVAAGQVAGIGAEEPGGPVSGAVAAITQALDPSSSRDDVMHAVCVAYAAIMAVTQTDRRRLDLFSDRNILNWLRERLGEAGHPDFQDYDLAGPFSRKRHSKHWFCPVDAAWQLRPPGLKRVAW